MFRKKMIACSSAMLAALLLAGCSSEPSSKEIEAAVSKQMDEVLTQSLSDISSMPGMPAVEDLKPKITINKKKCEKTASDNYKCEVDIEMTVGEITQKMPGSVSMVKKDGVWTATL